ncbi:hypothetical protein DPMN_189032 [Dreissena polymorpha]|uniref:Uncharacterized protein n=1 Tax=Dreissena polymorpha TaxID=45954 RepID=A0A9D4DTK6_DREPO|nr:hypothetical protein DPMN_189032 [Dreissena polymorpha]
MLHFRTALVLTSRTLIEQARQTAEHFNNNNHLSRGDIHRGDVNTSYTIEDRHKLQLTLECGLQDKRGALHSPVGSPGSLTLKRSQHLNRSLAFP